MKFLSTDQYIHYSTSDVKRMLLPPSKLEQEGKKSACFIYFVSEFKKKALDPNYVANSMYLRVSFPTYEYYKKRSTKFFDLKSNRYVESTQKNFLPPNLIKKHLNHFKESSFFDELEFEIREEEVVVTFNYVLSNFPIAYFRMCAVRSIVSNPDAVYWALNLYEELFANTSVPYDSVLLYCLANDKSIRHNLISDLQLSMVNGDLLTWTNPKRVSAADVFALLLRFLGKDKVSYAAVLNDLLPVLTSKIPSGRTISSHFLVPRLSETACLLNAYRVNGERAFTIKTRKSITRAGPILDVITSELRNELLLVSEFNQLIGSDPSLESITKIDKAVSNDVVSQVRKTVEPYLL